MAKPSDDYNSVPTVSPSAGMSNDYLNVRADPGAFGAQIGQAVQGAGQKIEQGGKELFDTLLQKQGILNDAAANNADSQFYLGMDKIKTDYKSLGGLDAYNAKDAAVLAVTNLRKTIRQGLENPAAQRSFDTLSTRPYGYTVGEIGDHAATQLHSYVQDSYKAGSHLAVSMAGDPSIANDPTRSAEALSTIKHYTIMGMFGPGSKGSLTEGSVKIDEHGFPAIDKNGDPIFLANDDGQRAKELYTNSLAIDKGQFWETRAETVANDLTNGGSPVKALQMVEKNKDDIPPASYAKILQSLRSPVLNYNIKNQGDQVYADIYNDWKRQYGDQESGTSVDRNKEISSAVNGLGLGLVQTSGPRTPEQNKQAHGVPNSLHIPDSQGVSHAQDYDIPHSGDSGSPAHIVQLEAAAERLREVYKNDPSVKVIVHQPGDPESNGKPSIHIQWAPNHTPNSFSPSSKQPYQSFSDYLEGHMDEVDQRARALAGQTSQDAGYVDGVANYARNRAAVDIKDQNLQLHQNSNLIYQAVHGDFTNHIPLTDISQLDQSPDPHIQEAWQFMNTHAPYALPNIQRLIESNVSSIKSGYGEDFYSNYQKAANGEVQNVLKDTSVGSNFTSNGFYALNSLINNRRDDNSHVFWKAEASFFKELHDDAYGYKLHPGVSIPKFESDMAKQMQFMIPIIEKKRSEGISPSQLFSPTLSNGKPNPEYVGQYFQAPKHPDVMHEWRDYRSAHIGTIGADPYANVKTQEDVEGLIKSGKLARDPKVIQKFLEDHKIAIPAPPPIVHQ